MFKHKRPSVAVTQYLGLGQGRQNNSWNNYRALNNNRGFQLCSCRFPGGLPGPGRRHFFPRKKRTCAASILSAPKSPALSQVSRRRGPRKFQVPLKHKTKPRYPHSGGATCSKNVQVRVLSCRPSCVSCDGCSWTKI